MRLLLLLGMAGCIDTLETSTEESALGSPNLAVTSVATAPGQTIVIGDSFTASDTTDDIGDDSAGSTNTRYWLAQGGVTVGNPIGNRSTSAYPSTGTTSLKIAVGTPSGTYAVRACADRPSVIAETNESDNCQDAPEMIVVVGPDFTLSGSLSGSDPVATDGTVTLGVTVTNAGTATSPPSRFVVYVSSNSTLEPSDPKLLPDCTGGNYWKTTGGGIPALAAGAHATSTIAASLCFKNQALDSTDTLAPGTYTLIACADAGGAIKETDETNNCTTLGTRSVVAAALPDLRTATATANGGVAFSIAAGSSFLAEDTLLNTGADTATATKTKFRLHSTAGGGSGTYNLAPLRHAAGIAFGQHDTGSATVTVPATVPAGTYYLGACADANNVLVETSDANNCVKNTTFVVTVF